MVPGSLRCRATSRPEPRSRPPCGVGVAAAAGLTRRLLASCCLPSAVCYLLPAAPVCRLLPWPTAVCYLRPSICCPSRPLPSVCRSLSTVCCLLPAAFRLPTAVYRLLPVACRLLPAALADRICHLLPAACCLGRPPSAAHCLPPWPTAICRTSRAPDQPTRNHTHAATDSAHRRDYRHRSGTPERHAPTIPHAIP